MQESRPLDSDAIPKLMRLCPFGLRPVVRAVLDRYLMEGRAMSYVKTRCSFSSTSCTPL